MLSIGSDLNTAIQSYEITAVSFITLTFSSTDILRITEAPRDITIGSNTFSSADNLAGLSAPQTQNSVDRDNYTISFTDNDRAMRARFASKTGVPLRVQLGFLTDTGTLVSELLDVYSGQSSAVNYRAVGTGFITEVGFTGQLTQLDSTNTRVTSRQNQQQFDSTDSSMNYVHDEVNSNGIKWGRR